MKFLKLEQGMLITNEMKGLNNIFQISTHKSELIEYISLNHIKIISKCRKDSDGCNVWSMITKDDEYLEIKDDGNHGYIKGNSTIQDFIVEL